MKRFIKHFCIAVLAMGGLLLLPMFHTDSFAEGSEVTPSVVFSNGSGSGNVTDTDYDTCVSVGSSDTVTVSSFDGSAISGVYLIWNSPVSSYTVTTDNETISCGQYGMIHDYVAFSEPTTKAVISVNSSQKLSRVRVFTDNNNLPSDVQVWQPPCEKADILVFSSHSDDEILFFGSAIAKYIYEKNAKVQVAYLTQYWNNLTVREHEKLDGLWCDGVRYYPVCGNFDDIYAADLAAAKTVYNEDDMIAYETSEIRRFKPLIVITHDFNGEYGHGFHKLVAESVSIALENAADPAYDEGASASYEAWDTPKAYFHNYTENAITLDLRTPVEERDGLCPVEIAALAYKQHVSQQWCWFYVSDDPNDKHPEINSAAWGLYRTNVGTDTNNDFFDNLTDFKYEDKRIHIKNWEDFMAIKDDPTASYVLDDDINFAGCIEDWEPFTFRGVLDGNGHAILNLYVDRVGSAVYTTYDGNFKTYDTKFAGIFDACIGATIKNLSILGMEAHVDIDESCFVGSLAGYTENTRITNCKVEDTRLFLHVNAPMFGVGGLVGYGYGKVKDCDISTTLVCVDKNKEERDEQFMGGVYAAGYLDVDYCDVYVDGYDSDHGYVHDGGIVGMYIFYPNLNIGYHGSFTHNNVDGMITFFEDNTNRRAYCAPIWGEVMIWDFDYDGNTETFTRNEVFDYSTDLYPDKCDEPHYIQTERVEPDCYHYGYIMSTCEKCGYSYKSTILPHSHQFPETGVVTKEPTYEEAGIETFTCTVCGYTEDRGIAPLVRIEEPEEEETEEEVTVDPELSKISGTDKKMIVAAVCCGALAITIAAFVAVRYSSKRRGSEDRR